MTDARRSLLEKYLQGAAAENPLSSRAITRRPVNSSTPVSFAQERLWFLDQLLPGSAVFNVPLAVRLAAPVNQEILEECLNEIVRRHEVLRTTFATENGQPVPVILSELKVRLQVFDLRHLPVSEIETSARRLKNEEAERPFDLAHGPLIRASLIWLDNSSQMLLVTLHHICSDGWSLVLFFQELSALYGALSQGQKSPLDELSIQYADYASWQREWLQGDVLNKQLSYWKEKLAGELPILDLPTDRARPAVQTYPGARVSLTLSEHLTSSLITLSRRQGATLFMTLLAAFKVLLYRHTGQDDIIVGSPIANRPQTETEKLIGYFLNNLALRTDLSGNPSFKELLARVRRTALDAYANQDVPFERLIEELKPQRDLSRTTIFQVYFNLFNFADEIKVPGSTTRGLSFFEAWSESDENLSKFDLTLYAGVDEGQLKLAFVYNTDLFDEASINELLQNFRVLLETVVEHPQESISVCSLLPPVTQHANRVHPINPFRRFEKAEIEQSIADRFVAQVKQHRQKTAVKTRNYEWTYDELNQTANRVANAIFGQRGISTKKPQTIALLFNHDAPMIGGLLGVLKAGQAYVPLDPSYPVARLQQILDDSQAAVLLTDRANQKLARTLTANGRPLINIEKLERGNATEVRVATDPRSLAYLLYTSGSTGQPKGVMQSHRNVLHFIRTYTNNLHLNSSDRLTLLSSYCFDASVMDIYGALLNGATLYPVDIKEEGFDGLAECLRTEEITIYHSTPTVYRHFAGAITSRGFPRLRLVVLGGEPVNRADVELFQRHFPTECLLVNGLGPTEATVSLQYFLDHKSRVMGQSVPVGYPVANTQVLLLDENGKVTEISGEIAIKCEHVALGYWRNDQATAAAFTSDADSNRVYRTGDLGRRLPDGSILFTGRKDSQIKIRGFRVELSEIETALLCHPLVRESVAVLKTTASGDKQLVAYVVLDSDVQEKDLRAYLTAKLPDYMVPSAFEVLESLPLTASGKLNRRALPEPTFHKGQASSIVKARSAVETGLAAIWAEVLGVKAVGVDENFFELGGHSLLAVLLFARIVKAFGKRLPLATLFQAPTVAQLAAVIEQSDRPGWSSLVPIQPVGSKPPFFCVHAKGGNVLEYYDLSKHLGPDQPFYGLQSQGLDNRSDLHTSIAEMAAHYIKEMRAIQPVGPYFIGGRSMGGMIAFEMANQLQAAGEEVGLLALLDTYPAGYLKLLPGAEKRSAKLGRLRERVKCHYSNIVGLDLKDQVRYLIEKAQYGPTRVKTFLWRKVYRVFEHLGRPLPRVLTDVKEFNSLAACEYRPHIYGGPVTLFWASADRRASFDLVDGWKILAPGGIDIHEISGSHLNLIKEPYVTELATKLKHCLQDAQQGSKVSLQAPAENPRANRSRQTVRDNEESFLNTQHLPFSI
jgi:amino acid adenylation domain-containing protein